MATIFQITTASNEVTTDDAGNARVVFTVTNEMSKPVRGIAKPRQLDNTQQEWLSVDGDMERDFAPGGTQQFAVNFSKPVPPLAAGAPAPPPEKFPFRLDVASA